ncbi:MAG: hypothetical protein SOI38_05450 [Eggerthellaceae bacterium]|jgi:hypothetical protein
MNVIAMNSETDLKELAVIVGNADEPYLVYDDREEPRLVVMLPAVLERLLFDSDLLNRCEHGSIYL